MSRKSQARSKSKQTKKVRSTGVQPRSALVLKAKEQFPPTQQEAKPHPAKQSAPVDFRAEYPYVYADLKRIGILAAIMFVVLIALALIVRL